MNRGFFHIELAVGGVLLASTLGWFSRGLSQTVRVREAFLQKDYAVEAGAQVAKAFAVAQKRAMLRRSTGANGCAFSLSALTHDINSKLLSTGLEVLAEPHPEVTPLAPLTGEITQCGVTTSYPSDVSDLSNASIIRTCFWLKKAEKPVVLLSVKFQQAALCADYAAATTQSELGVSYRASYLTPSFGGPKPTSIAGSFSLASRDWLSGRKIQFGVKSPSTGKYFLSSRNSVDEVWEFAGFPMMPTNALPFAGDFDGNGLDDIGAYDATSNRVAITEGILPNPAVKEFRVPSVQQPAFPLVGRFSGAGVAELALYSQPLGKFYLLSRSQNEFTVSSEVTIDGVPFGLQPLAGDWNGDGITSFGLFDPDSGFVALKYANVSGPADLQFEFFASECLPVAGDWNRDGIDSVGVYCGSQGFYWLRDELSTNAPLTLVQFGPTQVPWLPIVGYWGPHE